jgi:pimeloyl-ACP methyl ester carboxylesterase
MPIPDRIERLGRAEGGAKLTIPHAAARQTARVRPFRTRSKSIAARAERAAHAARLLPRRAGRRRGGADGSGAGDGGGGGGGEPRRRWKWPRRLLAAVLALLVTATLFSLTYNAATAGRAGVPAGMTFVSADGIQTRYREWGATGPPIVLVHGFAESADTWEPVARVLAARHRVYALDLTGWGYSARRGPYTAEHEAAQLLGFLDALRLGRATLVGHSTGAAVVAEAAIRAPGRVAGLVFLDGDGLDTGAGSGTGPVRFVLRDPYRTTLLRLAVRSDWLIRRIYGSQCGPACPRLDRAGVDRWRRPLQVPGAERGVWSMTGIVGLPAARLATLARTPVPKAVVFGSDDDVFSRSSPYETASRIGAPAPTIVPGARHLSFISHPGQVAAAIYAMQA